MFHQNFATKAIHAACPPDPETGAVILPISLSTTYQKSSSGKSVFQYSRLGNPTRKSLEDCVAALENGSWGFAFSSGMAAISTVIQLLPIDGELIATDDLYGGTSKYFSTIAVPRGLKLKMIDFNNPGALSAALSPQTRMLWIETPTNPSLKVTDLQQVVSEVSSFNRDILVVVDNTFSSPYFQRPLELGVHLVVHSATKYLNGHSDVIAGVVVGRDESLRNRLCYLQQTMGAVLSPFDCYMVLRGIKTLPLRMKCHEENAMKVATYLSNSPKVEKVSYPGLPSHPQYKIVLKQMKGFGGMVTVWLKGGFHETTQFLEHLQVFSLAVSLGGVDSLANHPASMTHSVVPLQDRIKLGIHDNMVRLSVGIEDARDLIADLENALNHVTPKANL